MIIVNWNFRNKTHWNWTTPIFYSTKCIWKCVFCKMMSFLWTHWGRVTHICVSKLTIIGSDNGLSPGRRQAIIWTNAGILLIGPLGTNFNEILIGIQTFSFQKMHLKMSSAKWHPFCLSLNVVRKPNYIFCSCYNLVSFLQNTHNRLRRAHPLRLYTLVIAGLFM